MSERLGPPDTSRFPRLDATCLQVLAAGHLLGRIHSQAGEHPTSWGAFRSFGPTTARFDHQPPPPRLHPTRAVLYAAPQLTGVAVVDQPLLRTCVAECFRDRGAIELSRGTPYFVLFRTTRELRLVDVVDGDWVGQAGGSGALSRGLRSASREWSRAIYRHYRGAERPEGIFYGCSNLPAARSVMLFERGRGAIPAKPALHLPLTHPALRAELEHYADQLGLDLLP